MRDVAHDQSRCATFGQSRRQGLGDRGLEHRQVRPRRRGLQGFAQCTRRQQCIAQIRGVETAVLPSLRGAFADRGAAVGGQHGAGFLMTTLRMGGGALEHCDRQATAGDALLTDARRGGQVDAGLDFVGEPNDGGSGTGLDDRAKGVGAGGEVRERPRLVAHRLGYRMNPHPHPGDDAECALGSGEQFAQVRAGRRGRRPADVQHARRRDDPHASDHVVESAVTGGVLTGGPGGGETADTGEAETLRKMAEGETPFAQQTFSVRSGDPGAEFSLARGLVEPVQGIEATQIKGDHGAEPGADRVQSADHTGAAAERHHRDAVLRAVVKNCGNVVLAAGE